ncbi:hypothetical protein GQ55_9G253900 [Panicum hallii var. hallii]|uniref:Uncharacterized protein n=1 Tax=Panicum hallii var. hallii TaxID=1504633 RepID=A0A2T7C6W5_9POAL|nr:hypothetical protein GQ55_9G253900 [Panicum hallii var. hallii]
MRVKCSAGGLQGKSQMHADLCAAEHGKKMERAPNKTSRGAPNPTASSIRPDKTATPRTRPANDPPALLI